MKIIKVNHKKGQRPYIQLTVRRVEPSVWRSMGFAKEHYLTAELNKSCKCLLFEWDGVPIGFAGILNTPRKGIPYGCSISRIVILPDYQGLGIGKKLLEQMTYLYASKGATMYIRTSHIKLANALLNSKEWVETQRSGTQSPQYGVLWEVINDRIAYSFKYIGNSESELVDNELHFQKKVKIKPISLFD